MKKMLMLLMTIISYAGYCGSTGPAGAIINYDGQWLILEKNQLLNPRGQLFVNLAIKSGRNVPDVWYRIYGPFNGGNVYVVRDTLISASGITNSETSRRAYDVWRTRKPLVEETQKADFKWLPFWGETSKSQKILEYRNRSIVRELKLSEESVIFFGNIFLFLILIAVGIFIRNLFNNYGVVNILLVAILYFMIPVIYLLFQRWAVSTWLVSIILIMTILLFRAFDHGHRELKDWTNQKRRYFGLAFNGGGAVLIGLILWSSMGHWQFMPFSLIAFTIASFLPFGYGKFDLEGRFTPEILKNESKKEDHEKSV
ncbi:MAG: hypothetical protein WC458_00125 [Patescibacteria group bacterium]